MIQRPYYIEKISPFIDKNIIKVLVGIRRCGKSCILQMIRDLLLQRRIPFKQIISLNLESKSLPFDKTSDALYTFIKGKATKQPSNRLYLLLDEIQEIPEWENLINALTIDFNVDIYLTGSNAKLLSSELATYLAGRYVEFHIYPFSFAETLPRYKELDERLTTREAFRRYVREGGMPFVHDAALAGEVYKSYLTDVFNSVILKDIAKRHKVRDIDLLERILSYIVSEIGHTFSAKSVVKYLKHDNRTVALETLYNFLRYANESCLTIPLKRNDLIGKQILSSQEKIYLSDQGFREALFGNNEACIDQILENIVAVDLVRRGYDVTVGLVDGKEIDFVTEKSGKKTYIQVAYLMPTEETRKREFTPFSRVADNYPKYVLSMDELDFSRDGIIHMPIYDYLLTP